MIIPEDDYIHGSQDTAAYEQITSLAASICGAGYAELIFQEKNHLWMKSSYGVLPTEIHFQYTVPLSISIDREIGSLSVINREELSLTNSQKNLLGSLARHAVGILELRKKSSKVEAFARIYEQSVDAVMTVAPPHWNFTSANPATLKLFGIESEEDFCKLGPCNISPERQPDGELSEIKAEHMIRLALEKGSHFFEWTHVRLDGVLLPCTVLLSRIDQGAQSYLQSTVRDISLQKKAEEALIESKRELQHSHSLLDLALDGASIGIFDWDMQGHVMCDRRYLSMLGIDKLSSVSVEDWSALCHPDDLEMCADIFREYQEGKRDRYESVNRLKHKDGHYIWVLSRGKFSKFDHAGNPLRLTGTILDITKPIHLENQLQEAQFVLDTIGVGKWTANMQTWEQSWDKAMYDLYGVSIDDFKIDYEIWKKFLTDESLKKIEEDVQNIYAGNNVIHNTIEIRTVSGEKKFLGTRGKVTRDANGKPIMLYGINWDRTKEVELEKNLEFERARSLHNSKLASIGQLAAGVGHEINNPLAVISGLIFVTEQMIKNDEKSEVLLDKIGRMELSVTRISNIVKGLRTFARSDSDELTSFDPCEMILETTDFLKGLYARENIDFDLRMEREVVRMKGNRGRLQQVLVNLITNARDATQGLLTKKLSVEVSFQNKNLIIVVKDNGCGIPEEVREHIFDPFFTTKDVNLGTGIGLSLVNTIVKEHEGKIELESEVGKGTSFSVILPLVESKQFPASIPSIDKNPEIIPCRILLVDDEPDVREVLAEILGYSCSKVRTASSGNEALEILRKEEIDIVLSDIKMPVMDGFDFLKIVREDPKLRELKFLFLTGGIEMSVEEQKIANRDANGVIYKPIKVSDVLKVIKELFPRMSANF